MSRNILNSFKISYKNHSMELEGSEEDLLVLHDIFKKKFNLGNFKNILQCVKRIGEGNFSLVIT